MLDKTQLNNNQIQLAKGWLPSGSQPYAYSPSNRLIWYWQTWNNGLPIKGSTRLTPDQISQLQQLN